MPPPRRSTPSEVHAGDSPSQMALDDLSMFRAIKGSTVLYRSDAPSTGDASSSQRTTPKAAWDQRRTHHRGGEAPTGGLKGTKPIAPAPSQAYLDDMGHALPAERDVLADRILTFAEFTHAHWFFGNLYELLVKVPHRIAASEPGAELPRSPFGAGSPGRYFVPLAPLNVPAAVGSLVSGWQRQAPVADPRSGQFRRGRSRYCVSASVREPTLVLRAAATPRG